MRTKVVALTVVLTVLAFLAGVGAPLGSFWGSRPAGEGEPTGGQIPLFLLMAIIEAVAFGLGVSFLFFGSGLVRAAGGASQGLARAAHLAISWGLISWWPHSNLHQVNRPGDFAGLLAIEYGFHATLIVAALIVAAFFLRAVAAQSAAA